MLIERFGQAPRVSTVDDPACPLDGVVVAVEATGRCRSDWHGWMAEWRGIELPHVPGRELVDRVELAALRPGRRSWSTDAAAWVRLPC